MVSLEFDINDVKDLNDLSRVSARIYLFGETHSFINDLEVQKKIIDKIKPKYYLYEMLEEKSLLTKNEMKKFLVYPEKNSFSLISKYGDLKEVVEMAKERGLPLIGCDIKDMLITDNLSEDEKMLKREKHQWMKISEYASRTKEPLFISLGAYHLREGSQVLKNINESFVVCYPVYNKRIVFGPKKGMKKRELRYIMKLKN